MHKGEAPLPPDCGPSTVSERSGILCLGAAPWVVNYNIALSTSDMDSARRIARAVSTRGGPPHSPPLRFFNAFQCGFHCIHR
eukprot:6097258-Pyramimonas_sp.AAC.1